MDSAADRALDKSPFAIRPSDQTRRIVQIIDKDLVMGGNLLRRLDTAYPGQSHKNMAAYFLFRHDMGLLHGIATSMSGGCDVGTCTCLARALLDTAFSLKYIVLEDGQRRAAAYMLNFITDCMNQHEMTDPTTSEGQKTFGIINASEVLRGIPAQEPNATCQRAYEPMKTLLQEPLLAEVRAELDSLKNARGKRPISWYTLNGGPSSIRELAERVGMLDSYVLIYKDQSRFVHGTAAALMGAGAESGANDDDVDFHHMRMERLGSNVIYIAFHLMVVLTEKCFPGLEGVFENWRDTEINPLMIAFSQNLHPNNRTT